MRREVGNRVTVSRKPDARDWLITFHKKGATKKEMGEKMPALLPGRTRQEADIEMRKYRYAKGNRDQDIRLHIFDVEQEWKMVDEWKAGDPDRPIEITGIDRDWERKIVPLRRG